MTNLRARIALSILVFAFFQFSVSAFAMERYMQLVAPGQGWTVIKDGLWWTQDDGEHWKNISPPGVRYMNDVFFHDTFNGWALFEGEKKLPSGDSEIVFNVAATSDGGATWNLAVVKTRQPQMDELDGRGWLDFVDAQHGWLALRGKTSVAFSRSWLLKTDDGGKTWAQLPDPPIAGRPSFSSLSDGWLAGGAGGNELYVSRDSGVTWRAQVLRAPEPNKDLTRPAYSLPVFRDVIHGSVAVTFSPEIFASGNNSSEMVQFTTADGGKSWSSRVTQRIAQNMNGAEPLLSEFVDSVLLFIPLPDQRHIRLMSVEEGHSSRIRSMDSTPGDSHIIEMSFESPSEGWILTSGYRLLSTRDGGATWSWIEPGTGPRPPPSTAPQPHHTPLKKLDDGLGLPPPGLGSEAIATDPSSSSLYVTPHLGCDRQTVITLAIMLT